MLSGKGGKSCTKVSLKSFCLQKKCSELIRSVLIRFAGVYVLALALLPAVALVRLPVRPMGSGKLQIR